MRETERLRNLKKSVKTSGHYFSKIKASNILFTIFFDLSVSRDPLSKPKNHESCEIRAFDFFCESPYDLRNVRASIFDIKQDARPFDIINDILRCLSLVQYLLKGRNAPIWHKREQTHMKLSGTDRLNSV